jgi:transposase-like protein
MDEVFEEMRCPACNGKNVIRKGRRKTKFDYKQICYCKDCGKRFTTSKLINKTYHQKVVINAISYYNLGNPLTESAKLVNERFKVGISKSSVHRWLSEFSAVCTYHELRSRILKNYGREILFIKAFEHDGLYYNFRYHKPKLEILCGSEFAGLVKYVKSVEKGRLKFFDAIEDMCSQIKVDVEISRRGEYDNVCKLASLALKAAKWKGSTHRALFPKCSLGSTHRIPFGL